MSVPPSSKSAPVANLWLSRFVWSKRLRPPALFLQSPRALGEPSQCSKYDDTAPYSRGSGENKTFLFRQSYPSILI